jgi:hypothetical protein
VGHRLLSLTFLERANGKRVLGTKTKFQWQT